MNTADWIENEFDRLAQFPENIPKLREFVLQLAVQGKLVPHDSKDEPASELLKRIAAEKTKLQSQKKIRKPRPLPTNPPVCDFTELPEGWVSAYLADCISYDLTDGDWVESKDQDPSGAIRLIQLADVGAGFFKDVSQRFLNEETAARLNCMFLETGDVLVARLPNPLGRACVFPGLAKACVTVVDVAIVRSGKAKMDNRYLVHLMNSPAMHARVESDAAGATRKRISTGNLRKIPVPIPPPSPNRSALWPRWMS